MVDSDACKADWPCFRRMMHAGIAAGDFKDLHSFLKFFYGGSFPGVELYPELAKLFFIACVLPVGSCSCERSFSRMKCVKTRLRSLLSEANLEWLMVAASEGPEFLSDEQADDVITRFWEWPGKKRYIQLAKPKAEPAEPDDSC